MTVQTKNYLKSNWITFANLIVVVVFIIQQSKWQQKVDSHIEDKALHMSFEKKIQVFVPRVELDSRLKNMEVMLERIENKIDN